MTIQSFDAPPIAELADLPSLRAEFEARTTKDKKRFDDENAALKHVQSVFAETVAQATYLPLIGPIQLALQGAYDVHSLMEGDRPADPVEATAWDEACGETIEKVLTGDIATALGQGWVGENTIGPKFHEPERLRKIAESAAQGMSQRYGMITTPEAVGLAQGDLQAIARTKVKKARGAAKSEVKATPGEGVASEAVNLLAHYLAVQKQGGVKPAIAALASELDLIVDYDEVLTPSVLGRLGFPAGSEAHFAAYAKGAGAKWAELLIQSAIQAADKNPTAPVADSGGKQSEKNGASAAKPTGKRTKTGNSAATEALKLLRASGPLVERDLAELLRVSKSTVNNILNDKSNFDPEVDLLHKLREIAATHRDTLTAAVLKLDLALMQ